MRKTFHFLMTALLLVLFGISNAQTTQWYGYALGSFGGEAWADKFISFNAQDPSSVQTIPGTFPEIQAATYVDGYVWFVTSTRSLCKVPFDKETQTFGTYEMIVPTLVPYNLVIEMAYNPMDGMMYFLCQDSQYNMNLKRIDMASLSEVEDLGSLSSRLWTLAIDSQGIAYGIGYPGDLYQVDLDNCALTMIGSTGKDVWYTQSMAFDLDTGELYWAQLSTNADHGLYRVDVQTGEATPLGEIGGSGAQLTGLFMVPENVTPVPEIITEIYVEGFTEPVWGEHPNFDLEVPSGAHYYIDDVRWLYSNDGFYFGGGTLFEEDLFDLEDVLYYLSIKFEPEEDYAFADSVTVFYNGDASPFNPDASMLMSNGKYLAITRFYTVTDPNTGIAELTLKDLQDLEGQTVRIYDMTGRLVLQDRFTGQLSFEELLPGVYVAHVAGHALKFVKQ